MPAITSSRTVQKAEAKYNVTTEYPNYGLHSAAATGNLGLVSFALTNGQPTNAVLDGVLPIHAAASGGNTRVVRMLIDAGADLNIGRLSRKLGASGGKGRTGASGSSMNIYTVGGSHIGTGGSTALHFAAANGHVDVLTLLLRCGADLNKTDKHGVTPLMLAERLGRTDAATTLRAWAKENPKSTSPTSNDEKHHLHAKRSLETLLRGPWAGSRVDLNASRVDLSIGSDSRGELGSGSSGIDLGSSSSRTELGELGFYPPVGGPSLNDSRRPSLPTSAGVLFGAKPHRPRSNKTSWSGGKMRRFFSRMRREGSTSWDAGVRTEEIDWAEEVEFRRGERVAVEMGLKAPSSVLMKRASSQNEVVRPRRKASEFHPEPEYDFLEGDPSESRPVVEDDMDDDLDVDMIPPKRVLHPRSFSSSSAGFSRVGMSRLTSPSMPILPLPSEPSLLPSAATSTTSIPAATPPRHTPARSHASSPGGLTHMRSLSGGMITRRGLRGSSSFSSFLPRQPEEVIPSSGDSTVDGTAPVANDPDFQPQRQPEPQPPTDAKEPSSMLEAADGRFRGDSLSSTDSENTNQLSSSMATTDTGITTPSLYAATSPLPSHKGAMAFSPVFEADDLDEADEHPSENLGESRRGPITPLNLRSVSTFEQAQSLVRKVEREILEPGPTGPDSPSLAEQLAAYGESLAIERRFARGEAQKRAWQAERRNHDEEADDDDDNDEEGGWAAYVYEPVPKIGAPLGRAGSVDYYPGRYRSMQSPNRTHSMPVRQIPATPLSSALMAPFSPTSQSRTPERASFTGALPGSQSRQNSGGLARAAMIPRRTASSHGSYVSRPSSIEIIETVATPVESLPYRAFELHRRSASTGVSAFPWTSYTSYNTTTVTQSPEQSDDDSHYELNSRTAPLSRITTAPSKIGNAIGNAFSRDPDYEPVRRKKLKRFVKQLVNVERSGTEKELAL